MHARARERNDTGENTRWSAKDGSRDARRGNRHRDERTLERDEKIDRDEEDGDEETLENDGKTDRDENAGEETLEREEKTDGYEEDGRRECEKTAR